MKILFRADSSNIIGSGHIMRDLVLAKQLKQHIIRFATKNLDGNINKTILDNGHKIYALNSGDVNELIALIKKRHIDMLIVDHYKIKYEYEKKIKDSTGVKIMVFDDTYEKHCCDILLNHNMSANAKRYKKLVPKKCEIRCGKEFTLIRKEFKKEFKKRNLVIFVSMGGMDHLNITTKILEELKKLPNIKVHVATMSANHNLFFLKEYCTLHNRYKKWIKLHIDPAHMAKLMRKSNFAILTPSVIVHEARYMRLPFIAIQTSDNQASMSEYLSEKKYLVLREFNKNKFKIALQKVLEHIKNIAREK